MNIKLTPKYWFADKETKYKLLLDEKYGIEDTYEKELQILNDEFPSSSEKELDTYKLRENELKYNYDKIDEFEFNKNKIQITIKTEKEQKLALLDNEYKFHKIKEIDYMKNKATINGRPFVAVKPNFEEIDGDDFYLDIEYNEIFIEKLKKQGYSGFTDDDIVEQWFKFKMINTFDNLADLAQNQLPTEISRVDMGDGKRLYK